MVHSYKTLRAPLIAYCIKAEKPLFAEEVVRPIWKNSMMSLRPKKRRVSIGPGSVSNVVTCCLLSRRAR